MTAACGSAHVERFRALLERELGWSFDDAKTEPLAELLGRRADAQRRPIDAYLGALEVQVPRDERRELARELTVSETYFFRNAEQFRAFAEVALPDRLAARATGAKLRILSAGCASGEEPYSLAIVAHEAAVEGELSIHGVDVSSASLEKAAGASYSSWSLRETPADVRRRWFTAAGSLVTLDPRIVAIVTFEEQNLASDDPAFWAEGAYDVVFCRNVMMYFSPARAQQLVQNLGKAIVPGGYLFLGHAETLRGLSQDFHLRHTHATFYYQRRSDAATGRRPAPASAAPRPIQATGLVDAPWAATWIDTVRRASERIHSLADRPSGLPPALQSTRADLDGALELLRHERFGEALDRVGGPADTPSADPSVLLLRAVLFTHRGEVGSAERTASRLLQIDELNAGAHYVLALCRESAGDSLGALEQDQIAAYLDPTFAMPRMHLGLLARRAGDRETASRELAQAAFLLQREEPSRVLLFGGGFSREGLVALCRAELANVGGGK